MSLGSQRRRAALGLALSVLWASAGCRGLPLRRPGPGQVEPADASAAPEVSVPTSDTRPAPVAQTANANAPAPLAPEKPIPLSSTAPAPVALAGSIRPHPGSITPTPGSVHPQAATIQPKPRLASAPAAHVEPAQTPGSSTPMLDAALARAGDLKLAVTEADTPDGPPADPSPLPLGLVPLGPAAEATTEPKPVTLTDVMDAVEPASEERKETSETDTAEPDTDMPEPEPAAPPAEPDRPEVAVADDGQDPWDVGLERLRDLAKGRADGGGNAAKDWTRRERLLTWMSESGDQEGGKDPWDVLISVLTEAEAQDGGSTSPLDFQGAAMALEQAAPLEVRDLRFCKRVLGFGDYEPLDDNRFKPGQSVILYCELAGLRFEQVGDRVRSRLSSTVEVAPASGGEPVWTCSLGKADDLCRRRRRDYYVNYRIPLPETLAPGSYQLRLIQTDAIADRSTARSLPFTITP